MLSNATWTAWINQRQRKGRQGERNDRSQAVHTGPRQRSRGAEGWRKVDAHSRQRTAPPAGKGLAGADRSGPFARMGALRDGWEPGYGWDSEAHLGRSAYGDRNNSDASRRSER